MVRGQLTAFFALVGNELRLLARDPSGLLMLFFMPALFIVVLSVALQGVFTSSGNEERLTAVVVDEDPDGPLADKIREGMRDASFFSLVEEPVARADAISGLADGSYDVVVTVPEGTGKALHFDGESTVQVILDPVISAEIARTIESSVQTTVSLATIEEFRRDIEQSTLSVQVLRARLEEPDGLKRGRQPGVEVRQIYVGASGSQVEPDAVQQYVPGWTVFALFWLAQILALNLLAERQSGIHTRVVASPISGLAFAAGKLVPYLGINLLQAVAMFGVGLWVLPLLGCPKLVLTNYPALALITVSVSCVSLSFGMFLASIFRSSVLVGVVSAAALIIMAVVGGIMVPKFVMPELMQKLSLLVPHGWALDGYLTIIMRGAGTAAILPNVGVLLGFALIPFSVAVWRARRAPR